MITFYPSSLLSFLLFTFFLYGQSAVAKVEGNSVDHAGILQSWDEASQVRGKSTYENLCSNCHGTDGITPALPLSPAFGKGPLKFGTDPYSMFVTLTKGNGLMGPQTWMSPEERYDVIHYITEKFMKPMYPGYKPITQNYLEGLPKVTVAPPPKKKRPDRDFGPALASQLGRNVPSVLTIKLGDKHTISYNLHSMDLADLWNDGFLDLASTQHYRERGEGVPMIDGDRIVGLSDWKWAHEGSFDYPTEDLLPRGPMPVKWMDYHGHYLFENQVILSYSINGRKILEMPSKPKGFGAIVQTLQIEAGNRDLLLQVAKLEKDNVLQGYLPLRAKEAKFENTAPKGIAVNLVKEDGVIGRFTAVFVQGVSNESHAKLAKENTTTLRIPASQNSQTLQVIRFSGTGEGELLAFASYLTHLQKTKTMTDLKAKTKGGLAHWPETLTTKGKVSTEKKPYVLDTLTLPKIPSEKTWLRTSALAFFPDGRMAVCTHGGDVWIVSGIDDKLEEIKWKRFAAGMYEPFGLQVIKDKIYVTCKDRLVRLHDLNGDDEADFYESFSADDDVSTFFHAFNFDLQCDKEGNFYYAKSGQYTSYALPGSVIKVSPDGKREVHCTGFRTPNGMGIMPDGRVTVSDNQGSWMPASKVSLCEAGGFYGYVQTHSKGALWAPDGGRIDHTKVIPPKTFDQPLIWMPQSFDNSSGGQLWVDDPRWGPLSGKLLHTSFGKGWLYYMMLQEIGGQSQAAIVKLKIDALTGIQRARVNPKDGQVYAAGLNGWNGGGRRGLSQGHIHRFRFTGEPSRILENVQVKKNGIELTFNFKLDSKSAIDPNKYDLEQWDYKWSRGYGSRDYLPGTDKTGREKIEIGKVTLAPDGKTVHLVIDAIKPVNQMKIELNLEADDGEPFEDMAYLTINRVPQP
jgi:mono/diheme cytochrome c family protein